MTPQRGPSLTLERRLMRNGAPGVVGLDEVGRGSLAGPITVGAVLVLPDTRSAPTGVRDSKALSRQARQDLAPKIRRWAPACAVGHASACEIDVLGIVAAQRLAALRALRRLPGPITAVLLDGPFDWLAGPGGERRPHPAAGPIVTRVKADRDCSSVAAASILAKVARDAVMRRAADAHPGYGWCENVGYSAPQHLQHLAERGPCRLHRLSWRLPGVGADALLALDPQRVRTRRRPPDDGQQMLPDPALTGLG